MLKQLYWRSYTGAGMLEKPRLNGHTGAAILEQTVQTTGGPYNVWSCCGNPMAHGVTGGQASPVLFLEAII